MITVLGYIVAAALGAILGRFVAWIIDKAFEDKDK